MRVINKKNFNVAIKFRFAHPLIILTIFYYYFLKIFLTSKLLTFPILNRQDFFKFYFFNYASVFPDIPGFPYFHVLWQPCPSKGELMIRKDLPIMFTTKRMEVFSNARLCVSPPDFFFYVYNYLRKNYPIASKLSAYLLSYRYTRLLGEPIKALAPHCRLKRQSNRLS